MRDLWEASKGPLLLAAMPTHGQGSADAGKAAFERSHLPMPTLWPGIPPGAAKESNSRIRRRRGVMTRLRCCMDTKACADSDSYGHILVVRSAIGPRKRGTTFCAVALHHFPVSNPAQKWVCANAEQTSCGRKRLGRIARNAGERRAGDGLSCLAPARTAQSQKRAPSPRRSLPGRGAGG